MLQTGVPFAENIQSLDRHGYLFGVKLAASLSPLLHSVVYRELGLRWEQVRLESTDMDLFLALIRDPKFYGAHAPAYAHAISISAVQNTT